MVDQSVILKYRYIVISKLSQEAIGLRFVIFTDNLGNAWSKKYLYKTESNGQTKIGASSATFTQDR